MDRIEERVSAAFDRQKQRLTSRVQNKLTKYEKKAEKLLDDIDENADEYIDNALDHGLRTASSYAADAYTSGKSKLRKWMDSPLAEKVKTAGKTILKYGLPIAAAAVGAHYYGKKQGLNTPKLRSAKEMNELVNSAIQQQKQHQANQAKEQQMQEELRAAKQQNEALIEEGRRIINSLRAQLNHNQNNPQLQQALNDALQQQQVLQQKVNTLKSAIKFKEAEITASINAQAATALKKQAKAAKEKIAGLKLSHQFQTAANNANAQVEIGKYSQAAELAQEQAAYQVAMTEQQAAQNVNMAYDIVNAQNQYIGAAEDTLRKQHNILTQQYPQDLADLQTAIDHPNPTSNFSFIKQTTDNIHQRLYNMKKQQPTRTSAFEPNIHKKSFKDKEEKKPEVRRSARILTKTGRQKYNRAIFAKQAREASIMQDDEPVLREKRPLNETPVPGKRKKGKGWADAARAFAPFMQTGFKVYQNHQYNEAARQKREMLAERLGVSPHDLEGLSSRGLLE